MSPIECIEHRAALLRAVHAANAAVAAGVRKRDRLYREWYHHQPSDFDGRRILKLAAAEGELSGLMDVAELAEDRLCYWNVEARQTFDMTGRDIYTEAAS